MYQDATWYGGRPWPRPHCARWGPSLAPQKRGHCCPPIFGQCLLWPDGWIDQAATWYGGRPQPRRHCVRRGPSSPSPKGTQPSPHPNFRPMSVVAKRLDGVRCLSAGDSVFDGYLAAPRKKPLHPSFGPCLLWPNGWMDEDTTWYESGPQPRPHCVRWGPT